ncbi:MAG: trypsin-like serine protease [Polyangiaceae bacterium]
MAVTGGVPSPPEFDAVLRIETKFANGSFADCTATLVAPNIVVTAKHCVYEVGVGPFNCSTDGVLTSSGSPGRFGAAAPSNDVKVYVGPTLTTTPFTSGSKTVGTKATDSCKDDIAFVVLQTPVTNVTPVTIARRAAIDLLKPASVDGWGLTVDGGFPGVRQHRSNVRILDANPSASGQNGPTARFVFTLAESTCAGDSGGPAFDGDTTTILGVLSRGNSDSSCTGSNARNAFGMLDSARDALVEAFAFADALPRFEGRAAPGFTPFGAECIASLECQRGDCLTPTGGTPRCATACTSDTECADGTRCLPGGVCGVSADDGGAPTDSGSAGTGGDAGNDAVRERRPSACAMGPAGGTDGTGEGTARGAVLFGLALALSFGRRRRAC